MSVDRFTKEFNKTKKLPKASNAIGLYNLGLITLGETLDIIGSAYSDKVVEDMNKQVQIVSHETSEKE